MAEIGFSIRNRTLSVYNSLSSNHLGMCSGKKSYGQEDSGRVVEWRSVMLTEINLVLHCIDVFLCR